MTSNSHQIKKVRGSIVDLARKMIAGECSYIEGSRLISGLLDAARLDRHEMPFLTFVAIDSETDAIPVGRILDHWSKDAKEAHASGWGHAEDWARSVGEAACRAVLSELSNDSEFGA